MPPESMTPTEFQEEALRLHRAGLTAEAEAAYLKVLESEPERADIYGHLSVLAIEKGDFTQAEARARKATELEPQSAHGWNNLGAVMACKGDLPSAAEIWRKALELDPDAADLHANLGKALRSLGKTEEAKLHLQKALELAPERGVPLQDLVSIFMVEGKDDFIKHDSRVSKKRSQVVADVLAGRKSG